MPEILDPDDPQYLPPERDGMHPPTIPQLVGCLHCGQEYDSYLMQWQVTRDADGGVHGWWVCPTPQCSGAGFGMDIWPADFDESGTWQDADGRELHVGGFDDEEFEDDEDYDDWHFDDADAPVGEWDWHDVAEGKPAPKRDDDDWGDDAIPF